LSTDTKPASLIIVLTLSASSVKQKYTVNAFWTKTGTKVTDCHSRHKATRCRNFNRTFRFNLTVSVPCITDILLRQCLFRLMIKLSQEIKNDTHISNSKFLASELLTRFCSAESQAHIHISHCILLSVS